MKRIALIVAILSLALFVGACGSGDDASREDAHDVRGNLIDKSRPHVLAFNNNYPNVVTKCLGVPDKAVDGAPQGDREPKDTAALGGGWRVVLTSSGHGSKVLLVQDPKCPGYEKGAVSQPALVGR